MPNSQNIPLHILCITILPLFPNLLAVTIPSVLREHISDLFHENSLEKQCCHQVGM